jgi:glycosyltransferase involved in cell wall biosynthesis
VIHWLPLEPLHERYTEQVDRWVCQALASTNLAWRRVSGNTSTGVIKHGQWLDTVGTAAWKTEQLLQLTKDIGAGAVSSGDIILVGDVWFPGIETVKCQCDLLGLQVRFAGWHHAGCFDPHDYLTRSLGVWGRRFEVMLLEGIFDAVAFGSDHHREFVSRNVTLKGKGVAAGQPWDHAEVAQHGHKERRRIVAFNHRWADEKRPWEFMRLAREMKSSGWTFAVSTNGQVSNTMAAACKESGIEIVQHASKANYYNWLATVGAVWSGADQETFGYSFLEAVALGVPVIAPNRLSYRNHLQRAGLSPSDWLYGEDDLLGQSRLAANMNQPKPMPAIVSQQYDSSIKGFLQEVVA